MSSGFETIVYFCLIAELAKQPLIQKTLIALAWASDKPARASESPQEKTALSYWHSQLSLCPKVEHIPDGLSLCIGRMHFEMLASSSPTEAN